ncbi:hypothetical protein CAPTEDRAFT_199482 [Capitella teleta]|uniref:Endonuclease/exonuclease/phosphatase domain-containing protein n=1 Tax=Capitella teleta TaxID=283909 RepID=R7VFS0_CAPTE|nr:hypothetical protein CAPTEDRAFT_199482 [Capitella teleta]|eukprot:ELU14530.1 hypothetical protein CAPTEDRAFT_199482 [Capitella teleta]
MAKMGTTFSYTKHPKAPDCCNPWKAPRQTSHHRQFIIGLLNARSAKQNDQNDDKPREIHDLIVDRGLDSLVITETWLREGDVDNIGVWDMTPNGFSCKHIPRSTPKSGGGLALIHASSIATKPLRKILYNSFECFITSLTVRNTSICVVAVYRPPNCSQPAFLSNFSDLLGNVIAEFSNIVIMGDFNINVASPSPYADRLKTILYDFNFQQHVTDATHVNVHTIDLIMSLTHEHLSIKVIDVDRSRVLSQGRSLWNTLSNAFNASMNIKLTSICGDDNASPRRRILQKKKKMLTRSCICEHISAPKVTMFYLILEPAYSTREMVTKTTLHPNRMRIPFLLAKTPRKIYAAKYTLQPTFY